MLTKYLALPIVAVSLVFVAPLLASAAEKKASQQGIIIVDSKDPKQQGTKQKPGTEASQKGIIIIDGKPGTGASQKGIIITGGKPGQGQTQQGGVMDSGVASKGFNPQPDPPRALMQQDGLNQGMMPGGGPGAAGAMGAGPRMGK